MNNIGYKNLVVTLVFLQLLSCDQKTKKISSDTTITIDIEESPRELEIFGDGIISTTLNERDLAISPGKDKIYYTLGAFNDTKRAIVELTKIDENWTQQEIASFSGKHHDIEPFISPDGNKFFFSSNRPIKSNSTRTDYNIWVMSKSNNGWEEPKPLNEKINTLANEFFPSVSKNGNLYFTSSRSEGPGREDIFLSTYENGNYQEPVALDTTINTKTFEFNAFISPNEDVLIFSSFGREDDLGGGDLYISVLDSLGNWSKSKNLGDKINSEGLDFCPFIDFENQNFYFTSNRTNKAGLITNFNDYKETLLGPKNGSNDIYRINLKAVLEIN